MSKIMSMFEKLKLVEKTNQEKTNQEETNQEEIIPKETDQQEIDNIYTSDVNIEDEIQPKSIEDNNIVEPQYSEPQDDNNKTSDKENFKQNNKLTIKEIYASYGIENSNINTIFMLGNFIDAIPESLPSEVRKKSVVSIVDSSNSDLIKLLGDGEKRLDILKQFSNECYNSTNDIIEEYTKKITELKKIITSYEEQIQTNQTLLIEQNNIIKFEIDKIESIIKFFNNGN